MTRVRKRVALVVSALVAMALCAGVLLSESEDAEQETEVRVATQRLTDGQVEFGVQVRTGDGAWSDPLLPDLRLLPADSPANHWRYSSAVALNPVTSSAMDAPPEQVRFGEWAEGNLTDEFTDHKGNWFHEDRASGPRTGFTLLGMTDHRFYNRAVLIVTCIHDDQTVFVSVSATREFPAGRFSESASLSEWRDTRLAFSSNDRHSLTSLNWDDHWFTTLDTFAGAAGDEFLRRALHQRWLYVFLPLLEGGNLFGTFYLADVFETPIQHLLEDCQSEPASSPALIH